MGIQRMKKWKKKYIKAEIGKKKKKNKKNIRTKEKKKRKKIYKLKKKMKNEKKKGFNVRKIKEKIGQNEVNVKGTGPLSKMGVQERNVWRDSKGISYFLPVK